MTYFQKISRLFLRISFHLLLITAVTFGFNSSVSLASTNIKATIDPPSVQLATMSQREIMSKNKEANSEEAQITATEEAKRFKAATLKGMDNSIVNPAYHPGGKTNKLEKQDNQDMKDIKAEASDMFNKS